MPEDIVIPQDSTIPQDTTLPQDITVVPQDTRIPRSTSGWRSSEDPVVSDVPARDMGDRVVYDPPVGRPVALPQDHLARATTTRRWMPDSVVCGAAGTFFAIIGIVALIRAGTDGPLSSPVVEVIGFRHTALLGLIELAAGVVLLASAAGASRGAAIFTGMLLGIAGVVGVIETSTFEGRLALERPFAWVVVAVAAVVVFTALLAPRWTTSRTSVTNR